MQDQRQATMISPITQIFNIALVLAVAASAAEIANGDAGAPEGIDSSGLGLGDINSFEGLDHEGIGGTITEALEGIDLEGIGGTVTEALEGIDLEGIGGAVTEAFEGISAGVTETIDGECTAELAAMLTCGLVTGCGTCVATAMGIEVDMIAEMETPSPAEAETMCADMKAGTYCTDLEDCIAENCEDGCKDALRAMASCTRKEFCDIECDVSEQADGTEMKPTEEATGIESDLTEAAVGTDDTNATEPANEDVDVNNLAAGSEPDNSVNGRYLTSALATAAAYAGVMML